MGHCTATTAGEWLEIPVTVHCILMVYVYPCLEVAAIYVFLFGGVLSVPESPGPCTHVLIKPSYSVYYPSINMWVTVLCICRWRLSIGSPLPSKLWQPRTTEPMFLALCTSLRGSDSGRYSGVTGVVGKQMVHRMFKECKNPIPIGAVKHWASNVTLTASFPDV